MARLAIALLLVLGCSGTAKQPTTGTGSGSGGPAIMAKRIAVSWGIKQDGEMADIYLQTTDETGKQVSHEVGRYKGTCTEVAPAKEMNALIAVACRAGGGGTELQAVAKGGDEIVVLKLGLDPGVKPDPMAREEVTRVKVPLGVAIEAGS
jgi:hypothetical protein